MAQVAEHLPSMCEALDLIRNTEKQKQKQNKTKCLHLILALNLPASSVITSFCSIWKSAQANKVPDPSNYSNCIMNPRPC
jgi:hypothetical protein